MIRSVGVHHFGVFVFQSAKESTPIAPLVKVQFVPYADDTRQVTLFMDAYELRELAKVALESIPRP